MISRISRYEAPDGPFYDMIRPARYMRPQSEIRQERATDHEKSYEPSHKHEEQPDKPRLRRLETMRLSIDPVPDGTQREGNHDEPPRVRHGVADIVDDAISERVGGGPTHGWKSGRAA
jgi:hypothetical protein